MRGSRDTSHMCFWVFGIIPAHAGLTIRASNGESFDRDHPRACGAHTGLKHFGLTLTGSSPRMRGSQRIDIEVLARTGIIPAHAGLTTSRMKWQALSRDHPRACGAHSMVGTLEV